MISQSITTAIMRNDKKLEKIFFILASQVSEVTIAQTLPLSM